MSKFLEILEQHDPANADNKNATIAATWFLYAKEIQFSSKGNKITLRTPEGYVVMEVLGFEKREQPIQAREVADAEEDESINASTGTYEVDKTVEDISNKPWLQTDVTQLGNKKRANAATKQRNQLLPKTIEAYNKGTERIKKGLAKVKSSQISRTY